MDVGGCVSPGQLAHVHEPSSIATAPITFGDRRTSGEVDLQWGAVFKVDYLHLGHGSWGIELSLTSST